MQHTEVDHLVIVADSLAEGRDWCSRTLGVEPQAGGTHALMGTHNLLLALSGPAFEQAYLEIIAIDPDAPAPGRARWFGMDDPTLRARVRAEGPQLAGFVARSAMIDMHRWGLINARYQPGPILKASRPTPAGLLSWQIVVADDGRPLGGGAVPTLIQWQGTTHPCAQLEDRGVRLQSLTVRGLSPLTAQVLRLRGCQRAELPGPALSVEMLTAAGDTITLQTA
jgi:Glyoxalase-like domain